MAHFLHDRTGVGRPRIPTIESKGKHFLGVHTLNVMTKIYQVSLSQTKIVFLSLPVHPYQITSKFAMDTGYSNQPYFKFRYIHPRKLTCPIIPIAKIHVPTISNHLFFSKHASFRGSNSSKPIFRVSNGETSHGVICYQDTNSRQM